MTQSNNSTNNTNNPNSNQNSENKELRDLATHTAGATDLHETRTTSGTQINAPITPNPGPYDKRATKDNAPQDQ